MRLADPVMLLALLLVPLFLYLSWRQERPSLGFSALQLLPPSGSWRRRLSLLPLALRLAVLVLIAIGLARPQAGLEKIQDVSQGVAIEMVLDRSGSMGAEMEFDGRTMSRLAVVKEVFSEFVLGNDQDLSGRPSDLIGMVSFARYADTVSPLSLAHGALAGFLQTIKLVPEESEENRTSVGDAIALAAARLQKAEETLARQTQTAADRYQIKNKIIILLTDGASNAGKYSPAEAAAMAKEWGIKIYTIGVGGDAYVKVRTLFGTQMVRTGAGVDRKTLQGIAEETGGIFRMAEDADALRAVYEEINRLEKSEVESIRFIDYREYFTWFAAAAFALLALEVVLANTYFRRIP